MNSMLELFLTYRVIIGQILGYVGVFIATLIYLQKTHKRLVFLTFFG